YAASKAGIIGLTKSVALELAPFGINVNAICPGFIDTEMTKRLSKELKDKILEKIPLSKFGTPLDIANMTAFLVSDYSTYITGHIFVVDGGMTI
ncbi:MAG: SDR family oxidoreductase, partial [bacterium]|nr:SDR family oxidoreductase [bacterium]